MSRGVFIVFEGGEGSGKSTNLELAYNYLVDKGLSCIKTREPGGIKISEDIRNIILDKKNTLMDPRTEALLYAAARRQHLVEKIVPALNEGKVVLCDRFIYSSLAYQGYAREIGIDDIFKINKFAISEYMPDFTIFFDLDPKLGLERISKNSDREVNRLDLESIEFHERVRAGYNLLQKDKSNNIIAVNANNKLEDVFKDVINIILTNINK